MLNYTLTGRNCVTFVEEVLGAGGIIITSNAVRPDTFFQLIQALGKVQR